LPHTTLSAASAFSCVNKNKNVITKVEYFCCPGVAEDSIKYWENLHQSQLFLKLREVLIYNQDGAKSAAALKKAEGNFPSLNKSYLPYSLEISRILMRTPAPRLGR
jgi:hypothetical protein